jgi:hypothetical protein
MDCLKEREEKNCVEVLGIIHIQTHATLTTATATTATTAALTRINQ